MLVLTRKQGEAFLLGTEIEINILEVSGDKVKIAINAPKDIKILRKELAEAEKINQEALQAKSVDFNGLKALLRHNEEK